MVQTLFGPQKEQKEQKDPQKEKTGIFDRLKKAVASTKAQLVERIDEIVEGRTAIDQSVLDDLEATLITADLGVKTTQAILAGLRERINRRQLREPKQLREAIEQEILVILENPGRASGQAHASGPGAVPAAKKPGSPEVIFVVGVNGVGKTTTIAKLANFYLRQNRKPLLCAADTFRSSANEQLEIWAGRLGIEIAKQKPGADPSTVIFDALASAKRRQDDPVIVDTAGRLHTKDNLMAELEKMCRTAGRA